MVERIYSASTAMPTFSAMPGAIKSSCGVTARPTQLTTPTSIKMVNSFLRMPLKSPNTPSTGASSATMAMAALVA